MINTFGSFLLLSLILALTGCESTPPPKKLDPNAGKHKLDASDPRRLSTYPIIVLVAVKHHIGIDTVAQLVKGFDRHFGGSGVDYEPQMPRTFENFEEDARPVVTDAAFFSKQGQRFGLQATVVADVISDFYLIGGSSRDFPDSQQ